MQGEWEPAIWHHRLVTGLDKAVYGPQLYDIELPRRNGQQSQDVTTFLAQQKSWAFDKKEHRPDILFQLYPNMNQHPDRNRRVPLLQWKVGGVDRYVVDVFSRNPLRRFENIPIQLASNVEGGRLEAMVREDSRITVDDFLQRIIPLLWDNGEPQKFASGAIKTDRPLKMALSYQRTQFRSQCRCLSWSTSHQTHTSDWDAKLLKEISTADRAANTTRNLPDLTFTELLSRRSSGGKQKTTVKGLTGDKSGPAAQIDAASSPSATPPKQKPSQTSKYDKLPRISETNDKNDTALSGLATSGFPLAPHDSAAHTTIRHLGQDQPSQDTDRSTPEADSSTLTSEPQQGLSATQQDESSLAAPPQPSTSIPANDAPSSQPIFSLTASPDTMSQANQAIMSQAERDNFAINLAKINQLETVKAKLVKEWLEQQADSSTGARLYGPRLNISLSQLGPGNSARTDREVRHLLTSHAIPTSWSASSIHLRQHPTLHAAVHAALSSADTWDPRNYAQLNPARLNLSRDGGFSLARGHWPSVLPTDARFWPFPSTPALNAALHHALWRYRQLTCRSYPTATPFRAAADTCYVDAWAEVRMQVFLPYFLRFADPVEAMAWMPEVGVLAMWEGGPERWERSPSHRLDVFGCRADLEMRGALDPVRWAEGEGWSRTEFLPLACVDLAGGGGVE